MYRERRTGHLWLVVADRRSGIVEMLSFVDGNATWSPPLPRGELQDRCHMSVADLCSTWHVVAAELDAATTGRMAPSPEGRATVRHVLAATLA